MYLLIDNSASDKIFFCLHGKKNIKIEIKIQKQKPLLAVLEFFLAKNGLKITDITGVAVVVGLGRFTATRIAVTLANTLGFALQIPVTAVASRDIELAVKKIKKAKKGVCISAKYSGEAHIGNKK